MIIIGFRKKVTNLSTKLNPVDVGIAMAKQSIDEKASV